ncbi:MAG: hypothetical protein R3204_01005 [Oceanospirillum sp.]|nr:hypothetical protein [Oceanospirillum sp.]
MTTRQQLHSPASTARHWLPVRMPVGFTPQFPNRDLSDTRQYPVVLILSLLLMIISGPLNAETLTVGKACPVTFAEQDDARPVGLLVFSRPWFHSSRSNARYIAGDNATGIGLEIHFFANRNGHPQQFNQPKCDRYRLLQIRKTTARLFEGEKPVQIDIPAESSTPFYDNPPMEHGYGTHRTPVDDLDKPWSGRPVRASTVAIYDTPYVSDSYGIDGQHIRTEFETCVVCERDTAYDSLLSCGTWGYQRDYLNEETGWTEPELLPTECLNKPSQRFTNTLESSNQVAYHYWLEWR